MIKAVIPATEYGKKVISIINEKGIDLTYVTSTDERYLIALEDVSLVKEALKTAGLKFIKITYAGEVTHTGANKCGIALAKPCPIVEITVDGMKTKKKQTPNSEVTKLHDMLVSLSFKEQDIDAGEVPLSTNLPKAYKDKLEVLNKL
jgi:hypothetical protein